MTFWKYVIGQVCWSKAMSSAYAATIAMVILGCLVTGSILWPVGIGAAVAFGLSVFWSLVFGLSKDAKDGFKKDIGAPGV